MAQDQTRDRDQTRDKTADQTRDQDRTRDQIRDRDIYGSKLMTAQERNEYRNRMRAAKTAQEREQVRAEHHERMKVRAKERGVTLPDAPPAGRGWAPARVLAPEPAAVRAVAAAVAAAAVVEGAAASSRPPHHPKARRHAASAGAASRGPAPDPGEAQCSPISSSPIVLAVAWRRPCSTPARPRRHAHAPSTARRAAPARRRRRWRRRPARRSRRDSARPRRW